MNTEYEARSSQWSLSVVYAIMVLARTSVVAVIPILALKFFGQASHVSTLYLASSIICLVFSIFLPKIISKLGLWHSIILAAAFGVLSSATFITHEPYLLFPGLLFQFLMFTLFESAINIYTTQIIQRRDLSFFESRRILFAGFTYLLGPLIGGWAIYVDGTWIPIALSGICAISVPIAMALLIPSARKITPSIKLALPSYKDVFLFASQPRLRLAWLLAVVRSWWWQVYVVYTPIFAVKAGYGYSAGGVIIALGSATLILAPFWQIFSRRYGLRLTFFYGYMICGILAALSSFLDEEHALLSVGLLIGASLAISAVDSGGNAAFLRAVRPHQRIRLVPIYNTYRDLAQVAPSALFSITLLYFDVSSVFTITGLILIICSYYCLNLNKRL
ncbi:MFS transporter [Falsochrobactrum sp. TDYN1]|uniref:MFS transporter n=1 Tax=Falsochrobactrum tianjinense TaxID=2706015 RepID=A0A949PM73_9HYPH|nr:MFS transporter [Falsochrobactrum sp. TDYN1]MBV2143648.1 MFS transporter [Falsochrobactrum sp. TDYN1]